MLEKFFLSLLLSSSFDVCGVKLFHKRKEDLFNIKENDDVEVSSLREHSSFAFDALSFVSLSPRPRDSSSNTSHTTRDEQFFAIDARKEEEKKEEEEKKKKRKDEKRNTEEEKKREAFLLWQRSCFPLKIFPEKT